MKWNQLCCCFHCAGSTQNNISAPVSARAPVRGGGVVRGRGATGALYSDAGASHVAQPAFQVTLSGSPAAAPSKRGEAVVQTFYQPRGARGGSAGPRGRGASSSRGGRGRGAGRVTVERGDPDADLDAYFAGRS
jgi:hypothetical protein